MKKALIRFKRQILSSVKASRQSCEILKLRVTAKYCLFSCEFAFRCAGNPDRNGYRHVKNADFFELVEENMDHTVNVYVTRVFVCHFRTGTITFIARDIIFGQYANSNN